MVNKELLATVRNARMWRWAFKLQELDATPRLCIGIRHGATPGELVILGPEETTEADLWNLLRDAQQQVSEM